MSRSRLIFVTYAAGAFARNLPVNGWFAKHFLRANEVILLRREDLEADPIYAPHRVVFDAARGAGYWAWKPWAIRRALASATDGDVVVYHDCGFGFRYKSLLYPRELLRLTRERGAIVGVRTGLYGSNRLWNHRECLRRTGAMTEAFLESPTIEASISFWRADAWSRGFVDAWLAACLDEEAIRDIRPDERSQQDPDFVEHRYDQAILTNLAVRHDAPVLTPSDGVLPFAKSISMLELDVRACHSRLHRAVRTALVGAASWRRQLRHQRI